MSDNKKNMNMIKKLKKSIRKFEFNIGKLKNNHLISTNIGDSKRKTTQNIKK